MSENGHAVISNGLDESNTEAISKEPRILKVEQAIPFSPFSSIVPFDSDIIPIPTIGLRCSNAIFKGSHHREEIRIGLENLNREVADSNSISENLSRNLNYLRELINPAGLTRYKFKSRPIFSSGPEESEEPQVTLSAFSQMVFDSTILPFTYSKTDTYPKRSKKLDLVRSLTSTTNSRLDQASLQHNAYQKDNNLSVTINSLKNSKSIVFSKTPEKKSVINDKLTSKPHSKYSNLTIATQDEICHKSPTIKNYKEQNNLKKASNSQEKVASIPSLSQTPTIPRSKPLPSPSLTEESFTLKGAPSKNKEILTPGDKEKRLVSTDTSVQQIEAHPRYGDAHREENVARGFDEREKADKALRNLQEYLQDIAEAEDQIDKVISKQFFVSTPEGGLGLNINTHTKLDNLLRKVIELGRFSMIEFTDLARVQRLCENTIRDTECIDLKINESTSEEDIRLWSMKLSIAELAVRSARTALRIMGGGREERQIYSEDTTQSSLNILGNIVENCIIPIVEMRISGSPKLFRLLTTEKRGISSLLKQCRQVLLLLARLVADVDLSDSVINALECIVSKLFFVENASSEKDSIIGISKFDGLRTAAMEVLSGIFATKPAQRRGIFAEFLTSLEKLPISKQNARQFKLNEGGNIQHASALIMRLIQISAMKLDENKYKRRMQILSDIIPDEDVKVGKSPATLMKPIIATEADDEKAPDTAISNLKAIVTPLMKAAKSDATYVIDFIVSRATATTKGAESSFRHLLDLFVQDFITCLGSLDWPAAELLLRFLLFKMIEISKSTKASSISRNMALDILSQMGPKISELHSHAQKMAKSVEYCQGELGNNLTKIFELFFEKKVSEGENRNFDTENLSWSCGPFRICLESLEERASEKSVLSSAIAFIKIDWANRLWESFDQLEDKDEKVMKDYSNLAQNLTEMIQDDRWLSRECSFFKKLANSEIRLAHTLILLGSPFCQYLDHILSIFLSSMNSGQAMVQVKSLKCLTQLLDTDPGTIDRHPWVKDQMFARLEDVSSSVRENTLCLISKLISLRPSLEADMVPEVLKRLSDANVSVRKRAIKLSKEIYMRNSNHNIRIKISKTILWKTGDDEPSIQELARQTIEEIWFAPLHHSAATKDISPQYKLGRAELVSLIVGTIETSDRVMDKLLAERLDKALAYILSPASKTHEANSTVCEALVESMFETVIDNSSMTYNSSHSRTGCFHILQVFATSHPKLFTSEHIQILHPYVTNLSSTDNAAIYNSVVNIFKQTLPHLSGIQENLLIAIRNDLLKSLAKLRATQLDDVIACMSIISETLRNFDNLTRVLLSGLETIKKLKRSELKDDSLKKLSRLLPIVGLLGKHCDFETRRLELSENFPMLRHDTVPKLITDIVAPLASRYFPLELRKIALQSIGYVCFSWPQNFSHVNVFTALEQAFDEKQKELETVVLEAFKFFLIAEEKRFETDNRNMNRKSSDSKAKLGVMGGSQGDGIALGIAQRFLPRIISVALSSKEDKLTLLSTEIIASIARQGLVHPKQPGVALITLGTTSNIHIAKVALEEHIALHAKHETLFERDYMTAVQSSYDYQRDIVGNTRGAWTSSGGDLSVTNYTSKLSRMLQVLNDLSKLKTRKKFFENICLQLDRNKPRKDVTEKPLSAREDLDHINFSQYVIENIAFFEYKTIDELLSTIHVMEKFVSSFGTEISHAIEQEILTQSPRDLPDKGKSDDLKEVFKSADLVRLRQLTAASIPLILLWEARSYLRNQYNLFSNKHEGKVKISRDLTLRPSKVPGVNGDNFWQESGVISSALESENTMTVQCQKFVDLLNFDQEFKLITSESDDDIVDLRMTPEVDNDNASNSGTPRGSVPNRKRKTIHNSTSSSHKKQCRPKFLM
ncbi:Protein rad9 [Golovinomyces cichoracearum]|uniref:Sister chromatid cohesion protein n=1 Tax=Golovinomyces cichoracearum TaxID=62708 RepID=A0A420HTG0_9PEZI|nr:Protein rad9 [Golovinomyces cichoracearum]